MNIHLKVGTIIAPIVAFVLSAPAAQVIFNIDPNQSVLTLSGTVYNALPYLPQPGHTGSLEDKWSGTIVVDITGGVLTFSGGSSITASLNTPASPPFSTTPYPDVPPGSIDNYGVHASGLINGLNVELNGAYRTLSLDITAGSATSGSAPSGMTLQIISGHLEWGAVIPPAAPLDSGTSSLVGITAANVSPGMISLTSEGVLTIPVQFTTTGENRVEQWNGVLVAVVPEPSVISLVTVAMVAICAARRTRRS